MGVIHFMGLGQSPGAVISAVSYLFFRLNRSDANDSSFFSGSGGRQHVDLTGSIEAIVFFSTPEIFNGTKKSHDYIDNTLGHEDGKLISNQTELPDLLKQLLKKEWMPYNRELGRDIYEVEIDMGDFDITFKRIIQTYLAFSSPGRQGKEIWVNLTGGLNIINLPLLSAGCLSALASRFYYINNLGKKNGPIPKEIRPVIPKKDIGTASDRFWVDIPLPKLTFDINYYAVLDLLSSLPPDTSLTIQDALERLRASNDFGKYFQNVDETAFRREILLKIAGHHLIQTSDDDNQIKITSTGENFLLNMQQNIFIDLIERGHVSDENQLINFKKTWLENSWVNKTSIP